ncbi:MULTISPECIES: hypothetical protein [Micromonospora]|uniref:hypothetical protein n=1 Tax=Micromonospora TaxID=1873 RepID=UPI0003EEDA52|nr:MULTISPECIES: hypothetical protein [unclassified Micromonospora]EWM68055.1 hypothetical protein MCBG_05188 [Micromonospora sp. M42]MCK1808981.1 hypothetical protein [Micromonospora sp. R42106]MCK1833526.1 hypothetical protein [Micromonospora sp. R42003]MCK1845512.1 hypothetical protein [Micromonospora sp. R42004]MCM1015918.1 hypothetical protein [Micromonospora sp. XM-20-01]
MAAPTPHSIMVVDIEGFGKRSNPVQSSLRDSMYEVVRNAFADAHLSWTDVHPQDRGDGILMLLPPSTSIVALAGELVRALDAGLREKAKIFTATHAMRFRVALHQGLCQRDSNGWVGEAINTASRLVDAQVLRDALAAAPTAVLAFAVSDEIYRGVIRHDYRFVDSSTFGPAVLNVKELRQERVWIQVPGYPYPPGLPDEASADEVPSRDSQARSASPEGRHVARPDPFPRVEQSGGFFFHGSDVRVTGDQVAGDKHVRGRREL